MIKIFKNIKINQFWLFTILVFLILMFPALVQKGMFLDGTTYAAIANNLANGIGSYCSPHYTKTLFSNFYEHPPLVFWLESFFFKIFGDHFWVENFYSFLTTIITVLGMFLVFNFFFIEKKYNWFVLLLWITIPVIFWAYKNNLLENTLTVFVVFSVYFQLKYFKTNSFLFMVLAGLCIFLAFLSKGFLGLFPLITPILYFSSVNPNLKKAMFSNTILLIITGSIAFGILFLFPELKENLSRYMDTQLLPALKGKREITTGNRFKILLELVVELTFPIIVLLTSYILSKSRRLPFKKESLFFFLVGFSASLPLIATLKQRKFYLVPSFAFFILAFCLLILPLLVHKIDKIHLKKLKLIKAINIVLTIVFMVLLFNFDGYFRDDDKIKDIEKIATTMQNGEIVSSSKILLRDWGTIAYLSRIHYVSLTTASDQTFFMKSKKEKVSDEITSKYEKLNLGLVKFDLYKHK